MRRQISVFALVATALILLAAGCGGTASSTAEAVQESEVRMVDQAELAQEVVEAVPTEEPSPTPTEVPPTATPEPVSTPIPPTATPEPTAAPTPEPTMEVVAYSHNGNYLFGMYAPVGTVIYAPFSGKVGVTIIRQNGNSYVWLILSSSSPPYEVFSLAMGVLDKDVVLLVENAILGKQEGVVDSGVPIEKGDPLVRITGEGASWWKFINDPEADFQVVGLWEFPDGTRQSPEAVSGAILGSE